jgi:hypothetical protein
MFLYNVFQDFWDCIKKRIYSRNIELQNNEIFPSFREYEISPTKVDKSHLLFIPV